MQSRELIVGLVSLLTGSLMTYSVKAVALEGRMSAIETTLTRIENRLYNSEIIPPPTARNDRPPHRSPPR
jgi:hypothetical protein